MSLIHTYMYTCTFAHTHHTSVLPEQIQGMVGGHDLGKSYSHIKGNYVQSWLALCMPCVCWRTPYDIHAYTHTIYIHTVDAWWCMVKCTSLFVLSSSGYPMIIYTHPIADNYDRIWENPAYCPSVHMAQCAFIVPQVKNCQGSVFVIFTS